MSKRPVGHRQCIGCHKVQHKGLMIRVSRGQSGQFFVDGAPAAEVAATARSLQSDGDERPEAAALESSKNGRSAYICRDQACLEQAIKKRRFSRVFKTGVPDELYEILASKITSEVGLCQNHSRSIGFLSCPKS